MRHMNGPNLCVRLLSNPPALERGVEAWGVGHQNLDMTIARVITLRVAVLDPLQAGLGSKFTALVHGGWKRCLIGLEVPSFSSKLSVPTVFAYWTGVGKIALRPTTLFQQVDSGSLQEECDLWFGE